MQVLSTAEFDPNRPDAVFDLDGTVFKFTVLEQYVSWLCDQQVFAPLSSEIEDAKLTWKRDENNEANYKDHTNKLVQFFIDQIAGKQTAMLDQAAEIVARQTSYRQWDITRNIINELRPTHNIVAISLMPEWLMPAFTRDLGFVARLGCTYVSKEGSFTGEAYSIDKGVVYKKYRRGDTGHLDVAMGDTMGDVPIFRLAKRPVAFNPSFTLASEIGKGMTMLGAGKDLVTVTNADQDGVLQSRQFHCSEADKVLQLVRLQTG